MRIPFSFRLDHGLIRDAYHPVARPTLANYIATPEELETYSGELFDLISKGIVNVRIHEEYNMTAEGIRKAQEDITSRKTMGKLIVKVA